MEQRILGQNLKVSAIGYGAMGLSGTYGKADDVQSIKLLETAFDLRVNFFDTADCYGNGHNETLLGKAFFKKRDQVIIATKASLTWDPDKPNHLIVNNTPQYLKKACEASLRRLNTDYIDLYYLHRIDPNVSIEESIGALSELVKEGKIRHIGLSEASPNTIRKAHLVHPLTAIQSEYSLWTRDVEYNGVLKTCNDLNIGFVPYSPLGRGFLTGAIKDKKQFEEHDFRRILPRFQDENIMSNLELLEQLKNLAISRKLTIAQLSLAWILTRGDNIVPIPGTKTLERLKENIFSETIRLSCDDIEILDTFFSVEDVKGERYTESLMKTVDH
jgi:aryl-alcohol dehydrogenase-like predicted oxidoreductase